MSRRTRLVKYDDLDLETGQRVLSQQEIPKPYNYIGAIPRDDRVLDIYSPDGKDVLATCVWKPLNTGERVLWIFEAYGVFSEPMPFMFVKRNGEAYEASTGAGPYPIEFDWRGGMCKCVGRDLISSMRKPRNKINRFPRVRASLDTN